MPAYVVRVWLPDRPGALGAVATRVGALRGDVVGIDIIDRGAGRAVDDLVVDLPDGDLIELLLSEIGEVEGVDVEYVRPLDEVPPDPAVLALHVARSILHTEGDVERLDTTARGARWLLGADWAAIVDPTGGRLVSSAGEDIPAEGWLCAFARGATAEEAPADLADLAVARLPATGFALVVGRHHSPLRGREQDVLDALAHLV